MATAYTPLERYLLSVPVPSMGLPALVNPTDFDLLEREATLAWERDADGVGGLVATLRLCGVCFLPLEHYWEESR